ncbi:MAG TPA: hypothetical protein VE646_05475 [Actinomycetota bacterium]|jgi:hypothetical protein|nr:hypothetical protein [Actinomycetota bacterium]
MLRRLLWIGVGIAIGYQLATRTSHVTEAASSNPAVRELADRGRSLADRAGVVGLRAVQRARVEIQHRLAASGDADRD